MVRRAVVHGLQRLRLGMLLVGSLFGLALGARDVFLALQETQASVYTAREFGEGRAAERWLDIRGRLATDHAHLRPSTADVHAGRGLAYVHVPVVAEDWDATRPVRVLATFGPVSARGPLDWPAIRREHGGEQGVVGLVRPVPLPNLEPSFPGLVFESAPVIVNGGTSPSPPVLMMGFCLLMLGTAIACGVGLFGSARAATPDG